MMLMAKDHFEISVNVNVDENPDVAKKLPEYFQSILDEVMEKSSELDVEIVDKKPRCRKRIMKILGKDTKMARYCWTGIGSADDVKKWKQIWNEVEGMRGPCFFIHLNPNPLLML
jgi:hypothetical protein